MIQWLWHISKVPFLLLFLLSFAPVKAQDVHLSQPFMNPLLLNPAQTANGDADWRLMANYRSQWRSLGAPFLSNIIGGDKKLVVLNQDIGVGGLILYDKSGDGNLTNFSSGLSAAYEKQLGRTKIRGGVRGAYVLQQFDLAQLTFPEQYDRTQGGFNQQLSNAESFAGQTNSYIDVTVGLLAEHPISKKLTVGVGITNYHLNQPVESFLSDNNRRKALYNYQGFAYYRYTERILIKPYLVYSFISKASQLLIGSDVNYTLTSQPQNIEYWVGGISARSGFNRNFDAVVLKAGLGFKRLEVGVSYDFTLSSLRQVADYRGALEFGVILRGPSSILPFKTIPCERL
tara:strand:- start:370 stop:1401 length:1032 start_codon:yes stop_codon:yes gene_type:complete